MAAFTGWDNSGANVLANSLSNLGTQFGQAIEKQGQRQLLSDFTTKMAAGDTQGAFQIAGQLGDPNLALKIAEMAKTDAADKQLLPAIYGANTTQPATTAPQTSQPNVVSAATPDVINSTATKYNINPTDFAKTAWIESRFNPNAHAGGSSAGGLFQFLDGTAKQYGLTNKFDPAANADAAAHLWNDNKAALTKALGREPTGAELYLAHQQGAGGASKLLANPNAPAASIVGADAIKANGGDPNMTAAQFAGMWTDKFNRTQLGKGVQQGPMPESGAPTQTAQNNTTANDGNPGYMPPPPASSSNPWGGSSWQSILDKTNKAIQSPAFYRASDKAQSMVKNMNSMAIQQAKFEMDQAGLPQNKIPAEVNARREQGRLAGLTGQALETFALTGTPPKPGDEMTPAQKKVSEKFGDQQIKYTEDLSAGRKSVNILTQMDKLISDPNFYSGSGGPLATRVKQFGVALGLVDKNAASSNEVFRSLANQLTLAANNGSLGAGVSNSDVSFLQTINPNEELSPEANKRLVKIAMADAQRKIDLGRMSNEYAQKHGQLDEGFNDLVFNYDERKRTEAEARDAQPNQSPQPNNQQQGNGAKLRPITPDMQQKVQTLRSRGVSDSDIQKALAQDGFSLGGY